jgi:hypothetical protein
MMRLTVRQIIMTAWRTLLVAAGAVEITRLRKLDSAREFAER